MKVMQSFAMGFAAGLTLLAIIVINAPGPNLCKPTTQEIIEGHVADMERLKEKIAVLKGEIDA
tara:strand:+ start:141 stop:329 length:189 start_codon:yes stop_codon:yes gene_type:complete